MITVLGGGVGAARYLRGLLQVVPAAEVTAIINTADDTVLRGWGLRNETWRAMEALGRFAGVRPSGSSAAPTWFNLGDQDLATHFYRTARLGEGATLTEVTAEIARAFGVEITLLAMTDQRVATRITVRGEGEISFQEYFVERRHSVPVSAVRFAGANDATMTAAAVRALTVAEAVVIAPSNPLVSIGPFRALAGLDELLAARRDTVSAVSPIVGGAALKGPADRMMDELGFESSVVGVARLYAPIASALLIDPVDAHLADQVEAAGMRAVVVPSIMSTPEISAALARASLAAAGARR